MIQLQSLKLNSGYLLKIVDNCRGQMTNFQQRELDFYYDFVSNTNGTETIFHRICLFMY